MAPTPAEVIAMGAVIPVVSLAMVALRFSARRRSSGIGLDDAVILLTLPFVLVSGALLIVGSVKYGYGQSSFTSVPNGGYTDNTTLLHETKRCRYLVTILIIWAIGGCKMSLLFFYRRIFFGSAFNIISWIAVFLVVSWVLSALFIVVLQCGVHVNLVISSAKTIATYCLKGEATALYTVAMDVATDLVVLAIPIYYTSQLRLRRRKMILVMGLFLFGSIAALASVTRLVVFSFIYPGHNSNPDRLGYLTDVAYFDTLETGLAVIAACLPVLGPLFSGSARIWSKGSVVHPPAPMQHCVQDRRPMANTEDSGLVMSSDMYLSNATSGVSDMGHSVDRSHDRSFAA